MAAAVAVDGKRSDSFAPGGAQATEKGGEPGMASALQSGAAVADVVLAPRADTEAVSAALATALHLHQHRARYNAKPQPPALFSAAFGDNAYARIDSTLRGPFSQPVLFPTASALAGSDDGLKTQALVALNDLLQKQEAVVVVLSRFPSESAIH